MSDLITHILFDCDGLLLDTERIYSETTDDILKRYGLRFTWPIKAKLMGRPANEAAEALLNALPQLREAGMTATSYLEERNRIHYERFPSCHVLPHIRRLVTHFYRHKIPMAVATSSHQDAFDRKIMRHKDLFNMFSHVVVGDAPQVRGRGKPRPDIFLEAARLFPNPIPVTQCLVFEDAESGVEAALAAGMHCVLVADKRMDTSVYQNNPRVQVLTSLKDLDLKRYGLPEWDEIAMQIPSREASDVE